MKKGAPVHPAKKTFFETVKKYRLLGNNDTVLVGFSGGPDSACLLDLLLDYFRGREGSVIACHVNHRLRGAESARDEEFAREFCEKKGVRFISRRVDVKEYAIRKRLSLETAARECRYSIFRDILEETGAHKIATAHHQDDLAETLLYRVFRGTGVSGLTSIPVRRGNIIRPLLYVSRETVLDYDRSKGLDFVTDSSNENEDFDRNYIRKNIMPAIGERFPAFREKIAELTRLAADEEQYWDEQTSRLGKYVKELPDGKVLDKSIFNGRVPTALVRRLVRSILRGLSGGKTDIPADRALIEKTVRFGKENRGNKTVAKAGGWRILSSYDSLIFQKTPNESKKYHKTAKYVKLRDKMSVAFGGFRMTFGKTDDPSPPKDKDRMLFAPAGLKTLVLRKKMDGDRIRIKGNKTKKIKELFIDAKVPLPQREGTVVIEDGKGRVIAFYVPERGFRVSEQFYADRKMKGPFMRITVRPEGRP